jgi:hypothetical protein
MHRRAPASLARHRAVPVGIAESSLVLDEIVNVLRDQRAAAISGLS